MPHAIVQDRHGGPEVLEWRAVDVPAPVPGRVRVRHTAIGVNFIDVYTRTGAYPLLDPPGTIGKEAAGVVEEVGDGVAGLAPGDRVAYVTQAPGAYSEERVLDADALLRLPGHVDDRTAAAVLLKGMTAEYLVFRTHPVRADEAVLVHAAAGATGGLVARGASALGATVIGTAGSEEKAALARENGCAHVALYREEDFAERTREWTGGRGVDVVYDGVGAATFEGSLAALATRGHLVSFGSASGPVTGVDLARLAPKSATVTRPSLFHYVAERADYEECAGHVFDALAEGILEPRIGATFPLRDAAAAHRALEGRETAGSILLLP